MAGSACPHGCSRRLAPMTGIGRFSTTALCWGVATGTATGAVVGTVVLVLPWGESPWPPLFGTFYGALAGFFVSFVVSLVGAPLVANVLRLRHPGQPSQPDVQRDLSRIFLAVVTLLDLGAVALLFGGGGGLGGVLEASHVLVAGTATLVVMLCRANRHLSAVWVVGGRPFRS